MKNQRVVIKIENPCHQKWDKMTQNEHGKFCDHCAKSVIDFTNFSDAELAKKLASNPERMCGRFDKDQLNRVLESKKNQSFFSPSKYLAGLMFLTAGKNSFASESVIPVKKTHITNEIQNSDNGKPVSHPKDSLKKVIEGIVYDDLGEPVPSVFVQVRNTSASAFSDIDGKFFILIPDSVDLQFVTLYTESPVGTGEDVLVDRSKNTSNVEINLIYPNLQVIGDFVTYKPRRWWQFWKRKY